MNAMARWRTCLTALMAALALPAVAQAPEQGLPRVFYGTPSPQVLYGAPSVPEPAPRPAPPPAAAPPPLPPQSSLTYQSGPAYVPPPPWWGGQPGWDRPPRPIRPPPVNPPRYVSPETGRFERPLPQGRYVGRPPSAPPEPPLPSRSWGGVPEAPVYGRGPGR